MKCFAWIESAVQALSKNNQGRNDKSDNVPRQIDIDDMSVGYTKASEMEVSMPPSPPTSTVEPTIEVEMKDPNEPLETVSEAWEDEKIEEESWKSLIEQQEIVQAADLPAADPLPNNNYPVRKSSKGPNAKRISAAKEGLHDASLAFEYNPAVVAYISSGRTRQLKTLKRRSSTSTIFFNSPLAPVTIVVTTPDDDLPSEPSTPIGNTFNDIRARRIGAAPSPAPLPAAPIPTTRQLARMSTDSLYAPDTSRLMPPTEQQIDTRRLRKAREFREVRKFLITFLNTKGNEFPKKLRCRMMDLYSINEVDLDPAVVSKFLLLDAEGGNRDEGVELEQSGFGLDDGSNADDLKILAMAFQSHIPIVKPRGYGTAGRRGSRELIVQPPPSIGIGAMKRRMAGSWRPETVREDEAMVWTGPLKTTGSTCSLPTWQEIIKEGPPSPTELEFAASKRGLHRLHKTASEPNLHRASMDEPPVPRLLPKSFPFGTVKTRNKSLPTSTELEHAVEEVPAVDEQQTPLERKRQNLIIAAFAGLRDIMGRAGKRKEKLRLLREESS